MDIGLSIMIRRLARECPRPQRAGQLDGRAMMAGTTHHKVLIVGGGTAGITVAASLKRHGPGGIDIAIVEPSDTHYYQPAFTLVGAGSMISRARAGRPRAWCRRASSASRPPRTSSIPRTTRSNCPPATRSALTIWWSAPG